ncbi:MAG: hypothetical protein R3Y63_12475 [Eubacteriales bacterium]
MRENKRTQGETKFFLGVRPTQLSKGRALGGLELQMIYRLDSHLKLYQASALGGNVEKSGQIMGIDTLDLSPCGDVAGFCRQVSGVVTQHGFGGVACLFRGGTNPCLEEAVASLAELCCGWGIPLIVPEAYGQVGEYPKVFISTAISGGSLEVRFRQAMEQYGRGRLVMDIEAMGEDFLLPAPKGVGEPLGEDEIYEAIVRENADVFFSSELCARYFTYQNGEHSLRFVLFDDQGSVREKIRLARQWKLWGVAVSLDDYQRRVGEK